MRYEMPLDVKCPEMCHVHGDNRGLVVKHKDFLLHIYTVKMCRVM